MARAKKAARTKPVSKRSTTQKRTAPSASVQKRAARDPYLGPGPSTKRIEQSFDKGTTVSLNSFRGIIDWS